MPTLFGKKAQTPSLGDLWQPLSSSSTILQCNGIPSDNKLLRLPSMEQS
jgi:hypothetical protein